MEKSVRFLTARKEKLINFTLSDVFLTSLDLGAGPWFTVYGRSGRETLAGPEGQKAQVLIEE